MSIFQKLATEHLRLWVLRILAEETDYTHNELVLSSALRELGHGVSQDQLRVQLAWLAEQELISVKNVANTQVARLSGRGRDVAKGVAQIPGVARIDPAE